MVTKYKKKVVYSTRNHFVAIVYTLLHALV